ncbi:RDD family protein [Nocardiopsis composta]
MGPAQAGAARQGRQHRRRARRLTPDLPGAHPGRALPCPGETDDRPALLRPPYGGSPAPYGSAGHPQGYGQGHGPHGYGHPPAAPPPYHAGPLPFTAPNGAPLAGYGRRTGAYLIDRLVITFGGLAAGGAVVGVFFGLAYLIDPAGYEEGSSPLIGVGAVLGLLCWMCFGMVYRVGCHSRSGRTLGKWVCRSRLVVQETCEPPSVGGAFVRELVLVALALTYIGLLIDLLWPLWDDRRQTVHDKAARTLVIRG